MFSTKPLVAHRRVKFRMVKTAGVTRSKSFLHMRNILLQFCKFLGSFH